MDKKDGWHPNTDIAMFQNEGKMGFGFIQRDMHDNVQDCCAWSMIGIMDPTVAKALCIREVLSWIKQKNLTLMIIETDCKIVVTALHNNFSAPNSLGFIIDDCNTLLRQLNFVSIVFVHRSANLVAHTLARASNSWLDKMYWGLHPPAFLSTAITADQI